MRTQSLALFLFVITAAGGCLSEEHGDGFDDDKEPVESLETVEQDIDRGWFGLYLNGIGTRTADAAGLYQELGVSYRNGIGRAVAYAQRFNSSPPTSWITGLVWANCGDGSQPSAAWNYIITPADSSTIGPPVSCPPGVRVAEAYFLMFVDN